MPDTLDYQSPATREPPPGNPVAVAVRVVAAIVIGLNLALLAIVATDSPNGWMDGWADVAVLGGLSPAANGLVLLVALACTPLVKRRSNGRPVMPYVLASVAFPLCAYVVDFGLIASRMIRGG